MTLVCSKNARRAGKLILSVIVRLVAKADLELLHSYHRHQYLVSSFGYMLHVSYSQAAIYGLCSKEERLFI